MSRKRTKQYLMLLMVVGLVSIAAGGSGTFASFSAETANNGNYFATGTLILNDNGGHQTCTSAVDSSNHNTGGTGCDTLFAVDHFASITASVDTGGAASGQADVPYTGVTGGNLYPGDSVTLSGTNGTETHSISSIAGGVITLDANLTNAYSAGDTITDNTPTAIAHLTLTNAGTIDASGISFKGTGGSCTASYTEGETTLTGGTTAGQSTTGSLPVASSTGFPSGSPVVVSDGSGHAQTFISTGAIDPTHIGIDTQVWNHSFSIGDHVTGPEFAGYGTPHNLCNNLTFSIIEESTSSFNDDLSTAAGCAYGDTTDTPLAEASACAFVGGSTTTLGSGLPTTFQPLTLASGINSNTNGQLNAGQSRYFLVAVHYDGSNFDNTYQNTKTTSFGLTWHIDQA